MYIYIYIYMYIYICIYIYMYIYIYVYTYIAQMKHFAKAPVHSATFSQLQWVQGPQLGPMAHSMVLERKATANNVSNWRWASVGPVSYISVSVIHWGSRMARYQGTNPCTHRQIIPNHLGAWIGTKVNCFFFESVPNHSRLVSVTTGIIDFA